MKRIFSLLLVLCLMLGGCGSSGELKVQVERETPPPTIAVTTAVTEAPTVPATEAPTEPTTAPTAEPATVPTTEPTEAPTEEPTEAFESEGQDYVLNQNSKKFHYPHCGSVKQMKEKNRRDFFGSREDVLSMGYVPCKNCHP